MTYEQFVNHYKIEDVIVNDNPSKKTRVGLLNDFIEGVNSVSEITQDDLILIFNSLMKVRIYRARNTESLIIEVLSSVFTIKFFSEDDVSNFMRDVLAKNMNGISFMPS